MSLVQAEIKGAVTTTDKQLVVLESKLEELNLSSNNNKEASPKEGKAKAIQQLKEERKALQASRALLDKLLLKAQEEAVAKAAAKSLDSSTTVTATFGN
jgi:TolA-binding protein